MTLRRGALLAAFLLLTLAVATNVASATVLTFDSLVGQALVPNGYGGFTWNNMYYLNGVNYGAGYGNGVVSPPNVAYNGYAQDASISMAGGFNFDGAYFTAAWNDENVEIIGTLGGNPVFDDTFAIYYAGPIWYSFGGANVDYVVFKSLGGSQMAIDNLTYNSIPEPGTLMLVGTGLLGVLGTLRRRML